MDSWSADQLKKMQAGGNNKLNSFLKNYGIDKHTDITVKYNSEPAQVGTPLSPWHNAMMWKIGHMDAEQYVTLLTERPSHWPQGKS